MALELKGMTISLKASVDMTGKKYVPVKVTGEHIFTPCAAAEQAVGFLQTEVKLGEAGQVMIQGITFAKAAAPIAAGVAVAVGANSTVATATVGQKVCGIALDAATAANDIISVLIGKYDAPTA